MGNCAHIKPVPGIVGQGGRIKGIPLAVARGTVFAVAKTTLDTPSLIKRYYPLHAQSG